MSSQAVLTVAKRVRDPAITFSEAYKETSCLELRLGHTGRVIVDHAVFLSLLFPVPVMLLVGLRMPSRGAPTSGSG